jgi:hypothetical protein
MIEQTTLTQAFVSVYAPNTNTLVTVTEDYICSPNAGRGFVTGPLHPQFLAGYPKSHCMQGKGAG